MKEKADCKELSQAVAAISTAAEKLPALSRAECIFASNFFLEGQETEIRDTVKVNEIGRLNTDLTTADISKSLAQKSSPRLRARILLRVLSPLRANILKLLAGIRGR